MPANSFGERFCVTTFGESHGPALGCVIDGVPSGIHFDEELMKKNLERRRPGGSKLVTARNEADQFEVLSGVFEGKTLGTPLTLIVRNQDQRSQDYEALKGASRPGHADDMWQLKFGHRDHRGGGRSSGRETVARVLAGSVAQMFIQQLSPKVSLHSCAMQIGPFQLSASEYENFHLQDVEKNPTRFPGEKEKELQDLLLKAKEDGESFGGQAALRILNLPLGLGQPVFHKLKADLAAALMSVGAVNGVELGAGFAGSLHPGTSFHGSQKMGAESLSKPASAAASVYGGVRGGISTGEPIEIRVSVKPTSSILDVAKKGRHDPCILIRALPVLESMCWLVLAEHLLWQRTDRLRD